jgi:hypothetical protein
VAPLRRKSSGSITAEIEWLHYADNLLAPLCRKRNGSIVPKIHNCGKSGKTIVRYDNETGKGDHRHVGPEEVESVYVFVSLVQLLADFDADIEKLSGEIK